jgi:hypothetical protein
MRALIPMLILLTACAPTRDSGLDDDDASTGGETLQDRYDAMSAGACDAVWSRDGTQETPELPTSGDASAYYGIYYGLDCRAPTPVGLISLFLDDYEPMDGATTTVRSASINDMDEDHDPREPELLDPGLVTIQEGSFQLVSGWWEGELEFEQDDAGTITLESIVFREAQMIGVAGR